MKNQGLCIWGFVLGVIVVCLMWTTGVFETLAQSKPAVAKSAQPAVPVAVPKNLEDEEVRSALLSYLINSVIVGDEILTSVWGVKGIEFLVYDPDEDMLYFSSETVWNAEQVKALSVDANPPLSAQGKLNGWRLADARKVITALPLRSLRVPDLQHSIDLSYGDIRLSVTVANLVDNIHNKGLYGGKMNIPLEDHVVLSNFAVFVQKANTLKPIGDLANQLTSNIEGENRKIQKLLDFVTGQIEYDERELRFQRQVLKRPLDTLLARQGTCGSKTVLFASLLEQVGHPDYVIVHYPKHVTVFVPGEGKNGYNLSLGGKTYTLAEATCEGFVIGQSRLETTLGKPTFFAFPSKGFGMYPDGRKMIF